MRGGGPGGALGLGSLSLGGRRMRGAAGGGLSAYAVNGSDPATVADFAGVLNSGTEYYRVGGSETTFASMFTHSRSSNATMVDSDGNLKWAPHNLQQRSGDLTNAAWTTDSCTVTGGQSDPDGGSNAFLIERNGGYGLFGINLPSAGTYTRAIWAKTVSGTGTVDLLTRFGERSPVTVTNTWQLFELDTVNPSGSLAAFYAVDFRAAGTSLSSVVVYAPRAYRSDLGGMVNNWDRGDSYVPTTSAARYLPRRNHYRWNGSAYVRAGILLESAAATNLLLSSNIAHFATNGTSQAAGSQTTPTGNTDGFEFFPNTSAVDHYLNIGGTTEIAYDGSSRYAHSIYVKARGSQRYISVGFDITAFGLTARYAGFDLVAGTVTGVQTNCAGYIEALDGGWYRCTVTAPSIAASSKRGGYVVLRNTSGNGTESYAGNTADGIYYYGSQVELGSVPTSYIPGATATRAAETLTVAGADMPYSATNMSFHVRGRMSYADTATGVGPDAASGEVVPWSWGVGTNNDYIRTGMDTNAGGTGQWYFIQEDSGVVDFVATSVSSVTPGVDVPLNLASRHGATFINGAVNGTALTANNTPTTIDDVSAKTFHLGYTFRGSIDLFMADDADWGDTGIEEITA